MTALAKEMVDSAEEVYPQRLVTYCDWRLYIGERDRCGESDYELLRNGTFESTAAAPIFDLVRRYCEACLNRLGKRLNHQLEALEGSDGDGFAFTLTRFDRSCRRLLFFSEVDGFPDEGTQLEAEIRAYMRKTYRQLRRHLELSENPGAEDASLVLRRMERAWS